MRFKGMLYCFGSRGDGRKAVILSFLFFLFMIAGFLKSGPVWAKAAREGPSGRSVGKISFVDWTDLVAANSNPARSRQKLLDVYNQLVAYSGKPFRVYPYQTNFIGLSKPGGRIMIDISVIGKPVDILAFWLAHEWAHQDLGHAVNRFATARMTMEARLRRQRFPTANEDEADAWAARFIARNNYAIEKVLDHMCSMPDDSSDINHSSWSRRAMHVAVVYNGMTGQNVRPSCRPSSAGRFFRLAAWQAQKQTCRACRFSLQGAPFGVSPHFVRWCMVTCRSGGGIVR